MEDIFIEVGKIQKKNNIISRWLGRILLKISIESARIYSLSKKIIKKLKFI